MKKVLGIGLNEQEQRVLTELLEPEARFVSTLEQANLALAKEKFDLVITTSKFPTHNLVRLIGHYSNIARWNFWTAEK